MAKVPVIVPLTVVLLAPPMKSVWLAALLMLPEMVSEPPSTMMRELVLFEILPCQVFAPLMLRKAPPLLMPLPFSVSASAATVTPEACHKRNSAPSFTVVPAEVLPRALALCTSSEPPATVVVPV